MESEYSEVLIYRNKYELYRPSYVNRNLLDHNSSMRSTRSSQLRSGNNLMHHRDDRSLAYKYGYGVARKFDSLSGKSSYLPDRPKDKEETSIQVIRETLYKFRLEERSAPVEFQRSQFRGHSPKCIGLDNLVKKLQTRCLELAGNRLQNSPSTLDNLELRDIDSRYNSANSIKIKVFRPENKHIAEDYGLKHRWKGMNFMILEKAISSARIRLKLSAFDEMLEVYTIDRCKMAISDLATSYRAHAIESLSSLKFELLTKKKLSSLNKIIQKTHATNSKKQTFAILKSINAKYPSKKSTKFQALSHTINDSASHHSFGDHDQGHTSIDRENRDNQHQPDIDYSDRCETDNIYVGFDASSQTIGDVIAILNDEKLAARLSNAKRRVSFTRNRKPYH